MGLAPPILSDPGGIQTHDLQNRNLTLYSAKLRDQCLRKADAKVQKTLNIESYGTRTASGAVAFIRNAGAKIRQKNQKTANL